MRSSGGSSVEHFQVMQGHMGSTFNVTYIEHGGIGLYSQHSDCKDCPIRCPRSFPASFCKFKAPQGYKEFWQTVFFLPRSFSTLPCRRVFRVQAFRNVKWGLRASVNEQTSAIWGSEVWRIQQVHARREGWVALNSLAAAAFLSASPCFFLSIPGPTFSCPDHSFLLPWWNIYWATAFSKKGILTPTQLGLQLERQDR